MNNGEEIETELATTEDAKPLPLVAALLLSLPLFGAGYAVEETFRWTNHWDGLRNGLFHMAVFSIASAIYLIPWALIIHFCYRKRTSKKRRTLWMLGPSILMCLLSLYSLLASPQTPQHRFKKFAKCELPAKLSELNTSFTGGGFVDYGDTYYFKTSSAEIDRLIREMKMTEDKSFDNSESAYSIFEPLPGSPNFRNWKGAKRYEWSDSRDHWFSRLVTDAEKTQTYIFVGCT